MQTEVPTLPVVNLSAHKALNRKQETTSRNTCAASKTSSPCRNSVCLTLNQKRLCPLLGGPYKSSVRQHSSPEKSKPTNKTLIGQRIMSAKMLRFKQLQNQLADAHYHLNELANENRLLKALQKRQDSALKKYEGTNAELPRIINSHHEELRVLQAKYKRLKSLHKETCDLLKDKENELQSLQSQNRHLLQLSKDRNLVEREKLQLQVSDLNYKIQQQQDAIQLLHRKLSLERKSLKQQLHLEISKHKETQKTLQETVNKLKSLEILLDNREKKLYYSGQLPVSAKAKLGSQSLTNLRDTSSNRLKSYMRDKEREHNVAQKDSLPLLNALESNDDDKTNGSAGSKNMLQTSSAYKTETMTSLDQVRRFRLQKLGHRSENTLSLEDLKQKIRQQKSHTSTNGKSTRCVEEFNSLRYVSDHSNLSQHEAEDETYERVLENLNDREAYKLSEEFNVELGYLSDDSEHLNVKHEDEDEHIKNPAKKSRELHARLVNNVDDGSDTAEDNNKLDNNEATEEKVRNFLHGAPMFLDNTSKSKSMLFEQRSNGDFYESNSDSEIKEDMNDARYTMNYNRLSVERLSFYDNEEQQHNADSSSASSSEKYNVSGGLKTWTEQDNSSKYQTSDNQNNDIVDDKREDYVLEKTESDSDTNKEDEQNAEHVSNKSMEAVKQCNVQLEDAKYDEKNVQTLNLECTILDTSNPQSENNIPSNTLSNYGSSLNNEMSKLLETNVNHDDGESTKCRSEETTLNKDDFGDSTEIKYNINSSVKMESAVVQREDGHIQRNHSTNGEATDMNDASEKMRKVKYNKEKLLATMKAIDNNENIEFLEPPGYQKCNIMNRSQITENLFRGLPAHTKKKENLIKDIFGSSNMENKRRNSCNKLH